MFEIGIVMIVLGIIGAVVSIVLIIIGKKEVTYNSNNEYLYRNQANTSNIPRQTNLQRTCPNCGQIIEGDILFCSRCGYKVY